MLLFISKRVYVIEDKSLTLHFKAKPLENFRFTTCQDEVEGMKLVTCCKVHNVHSRNINKTRHIAFQHELAREIYAKHEWKIGVRQAKCVTTWQRHFKKANDNLITCKTCKRWGSNFLCRHFDEELFSLWTRARFTIVIKISRVTSWRNESSRRTFTDNKTKTCSNRYHVCKCTLSNAVFPRFLPAQMENYVKHLKKLKTKNLERCFFGAVVSYGLTTGAQ